MFRFKLFSFHCCCWWSCSSWPSPVRRWWRQRRGRCRSRWWRGWQPPCPSSRPLQERRAGSQGSRSPAGELPPRGSPAPPPCCCRLPPPRPPPCCWSSSPPRPPPCCWSLSPSRPPQLYWTVSALPSSLCVFFCLTFWSMCISHSGKLYFLSGCRSISLFSSFYSSCWSADKVGFHGDWSETHILKCCQEYISHIWSLHAMMCKISFFFISSSHFHSAHHCNSINATQGNVAYYSISLFCLLCDVPHLLSLLWPPLSIEAHIAPNHHSVTITPHLVVDYICSLFPIAMILNSVMLNTDHC